eukprot:XP_011612425.1 PREDICTED: cell division cycle-associated protein 7-like isoform X1 [Takifugu rubripes]
MEGERSKAKKLAVAEVFADDSENEQTFYGFSDSEIGDHWNSADEDDDEAEPDLSPKQPRPTPGAFTFRLRVALRSTQQPAEEEEDEDEVKDKKKSKVKEEVQHARQTKGVRHLKFKGELVETPVTLPSPPEDHGSDSALDVPDSFLSRREQNIKANKAMLAQLMADLQKMPGGAGLLRKQEAKQKTKEKGSRPPRLGGEARRNPERASRRLTRSMGGAESQSTPKDEELELSLEEELLEVRRTPRRQGTPRPNRSKPHVIRPVEDITEDDIQLVADNMTDKVYNSAIGSTCHQCRQKTVDTKTCCRSADCRGIQGQFCGPCLRNRYGEDVRKALIDPEWKCPPCRGICNCSFCRQRDGRCPTGILFPLAQYHGFSDVHSYLLSLRNKLKSEEGVDM